MNEIDKLKKALNFLTSHIAGASELAEIATKGSIVLDTNHIDNPETVLIQEQNQTDNQLDLSQKMLDRFKTHNLNNLEVGRLYERYIGYLWEKENWKVTYKGIVDGLADMGRDLICIKGNEHKIIQAKCWSKYTPIREKHVYQLFASATHYRMELRNAYKLSYGRSKAKAMMKELDIKAVICSTNDLSETAQEVVNYLQILSHQKVKLSKEYPMVKCNINSTNHEKVYHLPFDPAYDTIIIGNIQGEQYVHTVQDAEKLGFRRVGT